MDDKWHDWISWLRSLFIPVYRAEGFLFRSYDEKKLFQRDIARSADEHRPQFQKKKKKKNYMIVIHMHTNIPCLEGLIFSKYSFVSCFCFVVVVCLFVCFVFVFVLFLLVLLFLPSLFFSLF